MIRKSGVRRVTRGEFLRLAGAGAVAGSTLSVLGACTANTTAQQEEGGSGGDEKALNFYNWTDYIAEDTIPSFEEEFGVTATQDFYNSNEELLAKLQAGGSGYDVIVPSDYMVTAMSAEGVLLALDKSKLPNFENIGADFAGLPFDPDNEYSVPYQWGSTGILYNPEVVDEEVTSWDILWDERYRGKIGMLDDVRETFGASLKRLGYSLNSTDAAELDEAQAQLEEQKPLLRGYFASVEGRDLVVGGDLALAHVFSGEAFTAMEENDALLYVIPEQGATRWTDNLAIPKSAPHPEIAYQFVNYILDPPVAAEISNFTYYGTPNEAALPMIDEEARDNPGIYPPPAVFDNLEVIQDLAEATRDYERRFTEVKSS